jgi:mannose-6-phosphate isomerase-like protein (cupin superfamily)
MAGTRRGWTFENPVTGERAITLEAPDDNPYRRLVAELHLTPDAAVVGEHLHPQIHERFEVLSGRLGVSLDGKRTELEPGEAAEVEPGRWHDWWNANDEGSVVRVEVTPGDRFVEMIRTLFGLAVDGKTNAKGMPRPLQLVAIADEFRDVIVLKRPPPAVQRVLFGALAPLARGRGYRGTYPRYAEAGTMGTPEDARSGAPLEPSFGPGTGPPR